MLGLLILICSLDTNIESKPKTELEVVSENFKCAGEFSLTAYEKRESRTGKTFTGKVADYKKKIVAVDRRRIPMGSLLYIEGLGFYTAEDTGGAIKGKKLDVLVRNGDAKQFGRKRADVWIIRVGRESGRMTIQQILSILSVNMRV